MRKYLQTFALLVGVVGLSATIGLPDAPAQVKDKVKDPKDSKAPSKEEHGTVEVYKDKGGEWRFKVTNPDGKAIAIGTSGHDKKEDVLKLIEHVKATLNHAKVEVHEDKK